MRPRRFLRDSVWLCPVLVLAMPSCSRSQQGIGTQSPSVADCATSTQIVKAGTTDSTGGAWGNVPFCGELGVEATVAAIIRMAHSEVDRRLIDVWSAGMVRDPKVFSAALALAADSNSLPRSRETALEIMARQHDLNTGIGLDEHGSCVLALSGEHMGIPPLAEPSKEHSARFAALLGALASSDKTDPRLRTSAQCIQGQLTGKLPSGQGQ